MFVSAALALKEYGPANFQIRVGSDGPAIFEINARFSGTTVMRALAGFNEVKPAVRWAVFGERATCRSRNPGLCFDMGRNCFCRGTTRSTRQQATGNVQVQTGRSVRIFGDIVA